MWLLDVLRFFLAVSYVSAQTKPVITPSGVVPVVQGSNLTLTCSNKSNVTTINYQWCSKNRAPAYSCYRAIGQGECVNAYAGERIYGIQCLGNSVFNLTIYNVQNSDDGIYWKCNHVVGNTSTNSESIQLDVQDGPDNVYLNPSTSSYTMIEEDTLRAITCSAMCSPACTYTWLKSGSTFSLEATLDLGEVDRVDAGSYVCIARNPGLNVSKSGQVVNIVVRYGPDNVSLSPSTTDYMVTEGDNLAAITCSATCNPACTYTWSRSGVTVSSTDTLVLSEIERRDGGSYICMARNPESSVLKNGPVVSINVTYGPEKVLISPATGFYTLTEGDNLVIKCSATCSPPCTYTWSGSIDPWTIPWVTLSYKATLNIGQIKRLDAGSYICAARNSISSVPAHGELVSVLVRYGPDNVFINPSQTSYTMTEGHMVGAIKCFTTCNPSCEYTWSRSGRTVRSNDTLNLGEVERGEAGSYVCTARNTGSGFSRRGPVVKVTVRYSPDIVISQSTAFLNENSPLDLMCKATGLPAVYNYTGFLQRVNDIVVPNSHVGRPGLRDIISVNIPSLRLQDTGVYTCYVHNGIIGHNKQLIQTVSRKVEVQASPRFLLEGTNFSGETSGNITIAIPFVSIPELTSYSVLRHDGQEVSTNEKCSLHIRNESVHPLFYGQRVTLTGNVLEITIRDLSEKDFGIYKMQITNDINTTNFSINVKATSRPSQPTELNLTTLDNIATFDWNKGFNGGYEQTFVLQTSLNSDDSWKNETVINESDAKYIKGNGRFQVHLTNLVPGIHSARLLAFNFIGAADPVEFKEQFKINEVNKEKQTSIPEAMIGGTAGGGIGVIVLVIVVVIIFLRKRKTQKGQDDSDLTNGQKLENLSHRTQPEDDNIPDEVENPMYVSGDDVDIPKVTTADIYATPHKKKSKQNEGAGDIYAVVDKKKKTKNK
ncbi:contactin-2-like, partial [Mya arenaria]|uniref:contactin-2-like n=1 Tax=Mya arenaria TaxID=6604 RepID=UPI0022E1A8BF